MGSSGIIYAFPSIEVIGTFVITVILNDHISSPSLYSFNLIVISKAAHLNVNKGAPYFSGIIDTFKNVSVQVGHLFTLRFPSIVDDDSNYTLTFPDKNSNSLYKFTVLNNKHTAMQFKPMLQTHAGNYTVTIILKDNNFLRPMSR